MRTTDKAELERLRMNLPFEASPASVIENNSGPELSKVFRLGRISLGRTPNNVPYFRYENRTSSGYVELTYEQEKKWRNWLMFQGQRQGGNDRSGFVSLTGLFETKKKTGYVGSVKTEAFPVLGGLMDEAASKGVDLVFFVGQDKQGGYRLYATVSRPRPEPSDQQEQVRGTRGGYAQQRNSSPGPVGPSSLTNPRGIGGFSNKTANNPPKDDMDKFLEEFDDK